MNEELQKTLALAIEKTTEASVFLWNKLWENFPELCNEIAVYGFYSNFAWIIFWLLILFVASIMCYLVIREDSEWFGIVAFLIIPLLSIAICTQECVKAKFAPRLYVIDQATKLFKK